MKAIGQFDLTDHGIEHSQFFQGHGVTFTSFEHCVTGIGDSPVEALDDCLEQISQDDFETEGMEARIMREWGVESIPTKPSVQKMYGPEADEMHYHVSIRWNEEG